MRVKFFESVKGFNNMLRICLIIAILAGLAAGIISFVKVQQVIVDTRADRDSWRGKDETEVKEHTKTKNTLKDKSEKLASTQKTLESTQGELAAANTKVDDLTKTGKDLADKLE